MALTIRNALVFDGSGNPPSQGDVTIADGLIASARAEESIDAEGLALAPGFIDTHTHDDYALLSGDLVPKISQGVTTVVTGNCGISLAPLTLSAAPPPPMNLLGGRDVYRFPEFATYLSAIQTEGSPVNAACLVGHATLRLAAMDRLDRPAAPAEIARMKALLRQSLEAGAIGLSTGLEYAPARAAPPEEIEELAAVCAAANGIYTTHMRDEGDHVLEAMEESFAVGRKAGLPVVISHHKCAGIGNFGRSGETLARLDLARADQEIGLDAYPYDACSTILRRDFLAGAKRAIVTWSDAFPEASGRDLAEIARDWDMSAEEAADRLQPAGAVYFDMDEADVRRILKYPATMIGSDGIPNDAHPHPRLWGSFPRVVGHYARDVGLFSMEEAIRKMTSLPAARFGLRRRGRIAEGFHADLVLFDPATIKDSATFEDPRQAAAGIVKVWVNGMCVWDGAATGARPGKVLRRSLQ